jgi:ABC-type dipeptide/oligopeptide/nickel transport system ATPase component
MNELLSIEKLNLFFELYKRNLKVLNEVNLKVFKGEKVAVVGESGSGKSVMLRIILGLLKYRNSVIDGDVYFDSINLREQTENYYRTNIRAKNISMIFQDPMASLNPVFTIRDQITNVIKLRDKKLNKNQIEKIADEELKKVSIFDSKRVLDSYPFQLSGGMAQRILIIMALMNKPKLVLADEPSTALDVTLQKQALNLMNELTNQVNAAVLLVTHNLGVVREFAERVYVIYKGNIVEEGLVEDIFNSPKHPYTVALLEAIPRLTGEGLPKFDENPPQYEKIKKYSHLSLKDYYAKFS